MVVKSPEINKVNGSAGEVLHSQRLARIEDLERHFGVIVDISSVTLRDISKLTSNATPFEDRINIIQTMLSEGDAGDIKLVELDLFMEIVTLKVEIHSNPTLVR